MNNMQSMEHNMWNMNKMHLKSICNMQWNMQKQICKNMRAICKICKKNMHDMHNMSNSISICRICTSHFADDTGIYRFVQVWPHYFINLVYTVFFHSSFRQGNILYCALNRYQLILKHHKTVPLDEKCSS